MMMVMIIMMTMMVIVMIMIYYDDLMVMVMMMMRRWCVNDTSMIHQWRQCVPVVTMGKEGLAPARYQAITWIDTNLVSTVITNLLTYHQRDPVKVVFTGTLEVLITELYLKMKYLKMLSMR